MKGISLRCIQALGSKAGGGRTVEGPEWKNSSVDPVGILTCHQCCGKEEGLEMLRKCLVGPHGLHTSVYSMLLKADFI